MNQKRRRIITIIGATLVILLAALIIIPSLLRSRITDGGPVGARTVRMLTTAQVAYISTYPNQGYAPTLAALGPDGMEATNSGCQPSAAHACMIDAKVGCPTGINAEWCTSDQYRYNIQSTSSTPPYRDYWITAAPLRVGPETKNYCSASDTILRSDESVTLTRPYTLAECLALKIDSSVTYKPD